MSRSPLVHLKRLLGRNWFGLFMTVHGRPAGPRRPVVLVVRTDGIGDLLYSLPLIEQIRRHAASRKTVVICDAAAVSLLRTLDIADELIPFDRHRYRIDPFYRWRLWTKIRDLAPETAINLQYHRTATGDELTLVSGAERTVALSGNDEMIDPRDRARFDAGYAKIVDVPDHVPERVRYDALVASEGWPRVDWGRTYALTDKDHASIEKGRPRMIGIAPGGSSTLRQWPLERWVELVGRIESSNRFRPHLIGGEPDRPVIEALACSIGTAVPQTISPDVRSVVSTMARMDLLIGIDAGISHAAARFGIPAIVLLGGGHFSRYFPYASATICHAPQDCYECNWQCRRDAVYCMTDISVESVWLEILRRIPHG